MIAGTIRHCHRCNVLRYCHPIHGVYLCIVCWLDRYVKVAA